MLSINDNWLRAMQQAAPEVRFLVAVTAGASTFTATDGRVSFATNYSLGSVYSVSSFSVELDIIKRTASINEVTTTFSNDGWMRDVIIANRLRGARLSIKIGEYNLVESDYVDFFTGIIVGVTPKPDGLIEIETHSGMAVLRDTKITGDWLNMHALQAISDILTKSGLAAALIDAPTMDPASYPTTSHVVVTRTAVHGGFGTQMDVRVPTSALELLQEVAPVVDGIVVDGEDGKLRVLLYDASATADDTWTEQDIIEIEQERLGENVINDCTIKFGGMAHEDYDFAHQLQDTASMTAFAYPGGSSQSFSEKIESKWLNGECFLSGVGSPGVNMDDGTLHGAGTTFIVGSAVGLCGLRWESFPGTPQAADAKLSDTRTAFLQFRPYGGSTTEIIEVDRLTVSSDPTSRYIYDPATGNFASIGTRPHSGVYRIKTRGALGTTPSAHICFSPLVDFTPAVYMARNRISRHSNGAPVINIKTAIGKHACQLGDIIAPVTTRYVDYNHDGLSGTTLFEIIGKEVDLYASPPCINWRLMWSNETSPPAVTEAHKAYNPGANNAVRNAIEAMITKNEVTEKMVLSGLTVSAGAGLNATIASGVASSLSYRFENPKDLTLALPASQTNWIFVDFVRSSFASTSSATQPTLLSHQMLIAKAVTSGVAVTSVINYSNKGGLQTSMLQAASADYKAARGGRILNPMFGSIRR